MKKITYIISDIDKALAFEWIAEHVDREIYQLSFILITQRASELESFLKLHKVPVFSLTYSSKGDLLFILPRIYWQLKSWKPDVVHCHLLYGSLLGLLAAKFAGVKKRIYTRHHSDFHHRYFPGGIKWDKISNRLATQIIAPSNTVKEVLTRLEGVHPRKIDVIPHGFELNYFRNISRKQIDPLLSKYSVGGRYPIIGVISRFTELKGIQYIIPAFIRLLEDYPEAIILFFNARGDYENCLNNLLTLLPERNYRLIAFENELSAVYRLFDVFIQASTDTHIEAFGQTYVEALAAGVPSVFTLSGIANDFIEHEKNALVVPFKNSESIYKAMRRILEEPALKEKLTAEGWNSVKERFALQHMIKKLEALYEK